MQDAIRKADVLIEALGWTRSFRDKRTLIKLGGSAMEDPETLDATLQDVVFMATVGMSPVLVHGGGKRIDRAMAQAGIEPRKVLGRRCTDDKTLEIVVRVLHETNDDLVRRIRRHGGRAVALHSGTLQTLFGDPLALEGPQGERVDLGHVGRVTRVDAGLIADFCSAGVVPVLPSLAQDDDGAWLNVNADTAAAAAAGELNVEKLVFLSDTPGFLRDRQDEASLIRSVSAGECRELIRQGIIEQGMIPKIEACLASLSAGVRKVHLIDGRRRHSLLLEIYTDQGIGTEIVPS